MTAQRPRTDWLYDSELSDSALRRAFTSGAFPVVVYGLGKMGLPLATVFADVTGATVGVDIDERVVESINSGDYPVTGEPGLPAEVDSQVSAGRLEATTDGVTAATAGTVHVVIVPTLVEEDEPDLSVLDAVTETIGDGLSPGDLVAVESTVPPRTCRDRLLPQLEDRSGLELGEFGVAFCPERTMSGRALQDIRGSHPKVVGGADPESRHAAEQIYGEVTSAQILPVADCTTAECVKVFEGLYRDVNIALANELATLADEIGVDVTAAIETANTQPYCDIHDPGPGVGGHCIPYYPYFITSQFETATPLLGTARSVNDSMPAFVCERVADCLGATGRTVRDSTVLVLGLTYRPGVDETRASPGIAVARLLADRSQRVYACDPVCTEAPPEGVESVALEAVTELDVDAIVLTTAHDAFDGIDWEEFEDVVVVDSHRALNSADVPHHYYAIGQGHAEW